MRVASSTRRSTAGRVKRVPVSSLHHLARACDETFDICTSLGAATTAMSATTSIPKSVSDAILAAVVAFLRLFLFCLLSRRRSWGALVPPPRRR